MDKTTLLNVAANAKVPYPEPGEKGGGNKNSAHDDRSPSCTIR